MQLINLVLASIAIAGASAGPIQRLVPVKFCHPTCSIANGEQKL
jgi:hypothetical protein